MSVFRGPVQGQLPDGSVIATASEVAKALEDALAAKGAAEAAQQAAEAALDNFDDRYLGSKASDPTVDNDEDALIDGALYYNTTDNAVKVYDLATDSWISFALSNEQRADLSAVADISADVETVSDNVTNVQTVATDLSGTDTIGTVSTNITDVNTVGQNIADVTVAANNVADISTVATDISSVTAVATDISDVIFVSENIADILTAAQASEDAANARDKAEEWASNPEDVEVEPGLFSSFHYAQKSEDSASAASTSESNALTSENNASNSASAALTSEQNASDSADAAAISESNAETSAQEAASTYDDFDDRYLGPKTSAPATDNDGDPLQVGALYFDTSSNTMQVFSDTGFVPAGSSVNGTSDRFKYTATAGQTTFSGIDDDGSSLTYDSGFLDVYLNGVRLINGTDFTATTGTSIVLNSGAGAGDVLSVVAFGTFALADHYTKTESDNRYLRPDTVEPTFTGTAALGIPTGTTTERPGTPSVGQFRFNVNEQAFEGYDGSAWSSIGSGEKGTLTKTFVTGESANINLSDSVLVPVVSVTKEVPQEDITNNDWDVASDGSNFTLHDTAYDTTLTPSNATGNGTFTLGTGSFASTDVGKRIVGNGGEAILTATDGSYELQTAFNDDSTIPAGDWSMFALDVESADAGLRIGKFSSTSSTTAVATWSMENDGTDLGGQYPLSVNGGNFSTESKYGDYSFFVPNDGTDSNYLVRDQNDIDITGQSGDGSFSFSAWVRPKQDTLNSGFNCIFVLGDTNEYDAFQLLLSGGELSLYSSGGGTASGTRLPLSADTWHHVALTFDASSGEARSYLDGVELEKSTGSSPLSSPTSCNILLMQEPDTGNPYGDFSTTQAFFGNIDQVRLFSQELSQEEVKSISTLDQNPSSQNVAFFQNFASATSTNHTAITTTSTNTEFWTDINSMTTDDSVNDGAVYYAVSTDGRTTWKIIDGTNGERNIVRNNGGTWEYNSDTTYGSETWVAATENDEFYAIEEATSVATNQMDATQLNAASDANHYTLGNDLDLAITMFMADGGAISPTSDGVAINYDAQVKNAGAILGSDYEWEALSNSTVRITSLADQNLKVRVV